MRGQTRTDPNSSSPRWQHRNLMGGLRFLVNAMQRPWNWSRKSPASPETRRTTGQSNQSRLRMLKFYGAQAIDGRNFRAPKNALNFVLLLQPRNHAKILQGRRVSLNVPATRQFPQQTTHDLSTACLGEHVRETDVIRLCESANLLGYPPFQLFFQFRAGRDTMLERDKRRNRLPLDVI